VLHHASSTSEGVCGEMDLSGVLAFHFSKNVSVNVTFQPLYASAMQPAEDYTLKQILTFFLLRKLNMFPFIDFGTLNTKMVRKGLIGYSFEEDYIN
jgi:hypothetical protein